MFTLSARKVAIVAVLGAGSVLSAGAFAAQAASTPSADDVVRPASVTTTYDDMPDLRGDGTLDDDGALDVDDDYLDDDGIDDDYLDDDDGLDDDGVEDDDIDVDGTDDVVASTPSPVALPTDADHSQGDDSGHDHSDDDDSASDDDSDDDYDDDSDDAGDDSGHGGEED